ncbi:MAG: hypothetical protein ACOYM4_20365 [Nodosilinea sp.]
MTLDTPRSRSLYGSLLLHRNGKFALIVGLVALFFYCAAAGP